MTDDLSTAAPQIEAHPRLIPTGNTLVSMPDIDVATGAVATLSCLSEKRLGLLELHGGDRPLASPVFEIDGRRVSPELVWTRLEGWIPDATAATPAGQLRLSYLAPHGARGIERGVALRAALTNTTDREVRVRLGWTGRFSACRTARFATDELDVTLASGYDAWTRSTTIAARTADAPAVAIGIQSSGAVGLHGTAWDVTVVQVVAPGESVEVVTHLSLGIDAEAARLGALHLRRRGWDAMLADTREWLAKRALPAPDDATSARVNANLFFNFFFAQGDCLDSGRPTILTSRSTHYYVSAAFWSRDSYLWTYPALLLADPLRARDLLVESLRAAGDRYPDHALHLNGTSLYPGFELDQAAAPFLALWRYCTTTGDRTVLDDPVIVRLIERFPSIIEPWWSEELGLYGTFLLPTDDPTAYPYVAVDNALVAVACEAIHRLAGDGEGRTDWFSRRAEALRDSIRRRLVLTTDDGTQRFAWAIDADGAHEQRDEPPVSLRLLPYLGVCDERDPVFRATEAWLDGGGYRYHYPGRYGGNGAPHFPFPSGFDLANRILAGDARAVDTLVDAPMDNGLGCESWDPDSGDVRTGAAMASMAGLLAWTYWAHRSGHRRWDEPLPLPLPSGRS